MNGVMFFDDALFAAMAAVGFSSISHTPRCVYAPCAFAAAAGHSLRTLLMLSDFTGLNIIAASTIAAFAIGIVAVLSARVVRVPAEACLFPALLPMIPGMYAYRTVAATVRLVGGGSDAETLRCLSDLFFNGISCVSIVIGMAIGAVLPMFMMKKLSFQATR